MTTPVIQYPPPRNTNLHINILFRLATAAVFAAGTAAVLAADDEAVSNAEAVKGVWILAGNSGTAINSIEDLQSLHRTLDPALAIDGVKGFSLRVTWSAIHRDLSLLEHGKRIADERGLAFSFRVLAGYRVPPELFADGSPWYLDPEGRDRKIPTPFQPDGSPNEVFERHYSAMLRTVTTWARANGVRLVHCPWYGLSWAELNHHIAVRRAPGYTYDRWFDAHTRLFDLAVAFADERLAIELPMSGGGPTGDSVAQLADHAWARLGPKSDRFFFSANGWGPGGYWGSPNPEMEMLKRRAFERPLLRGLQSIRQGAYDWRELFADLRDVHVTYCEIYAETLDFAGADVMREEIKRFAEEVARSPAPTPPDGAPHPPRLTQQPAETNAAALAGRWLERSVADEATIQRAVDAAAAANARGLIAKVSWAQLEPSWALAELARDAAIHRGLRFALALTDGALPERLLLNTSGRAVEYEKFIAHLAGWCRANEVRLLVVPDPDANTPGAVVDFAARQSGRALLVYPRGTLPAGEFIDFPVTDESRFRH